MSAKQLTGKQMDVYERVWTRVMLASGAMLIPTLLGTYFFWSDRPKMLACAIGAGASTVVLLIAAAKLRELDRGFGKSDREKRGRMQSALEQLDD